MIGEDGHGQSADVHPVYLARVDVEREEDTAQLVICGSGEVRSAARQTTSQLQFPK